MDQLIEKVKLSLLNESLDSAVEYYMTADTNIPISIYAKFDIGTDSYAVIINQSTVPEVYKVSIGRVPGTYLKLWQIKPNHLRTVISTALKVIESAIPLLGTKAKGYAFQLPKDVKKNYVSLLNRIIKTSFIKTMKAINVDNTNASTPFLFITRVSVDPVSLFKGKEFKDFNFKGAASAPMSSPHVAPSSAINGVVGKLVAKHTPGSVQHAPDSNVTKKEQLYSVSDIHPVGSTNLGVSALGQQPGKDWHWILNPDGSLENAAGKNIEAKTPYIGGSIAGSASMTFYIPFMLHKSNASEIPVKDFLANLPKYSGVVRKLVAKHTPGSVQHASVYNFTKKEQLYSAAHISPTGLPNLRLSAHGQHPAAANHWILNQDGSLENAAGKDIKIGTPYFGGSIAGALPVAIYIPFMLGKGYNVPKILVKDFLANLDKYSGVSNPTGSTGQTVIPAEALELVQDKKPLKVSIDPTPSKKWSFFKHDKEITVRLVNSEIAPEEVFPIKIYGQGTSIPAPVPVPSVSLASTKELPTIWAVLKNEQEEHPHDSPEYLTAALYADFHPTAHFSPFQKAMAKNNGFYTGKKSESITHFNSLAPEGQKALFAKMKELHKKIPDKISKNTAPLVVAKAPEYTSTNSGAVAFYAKVQSEAAAWTNTIAPVKDESEKEYYSLDEWVEKEFARTGTVGTPFVGALEVRSAAMFFKARAMVSNPIEWKQIIQTPGLWKPKWVSANDWGEIGARIIKKIDNGSLGQDAVDAFKKIQNQWAGEKHVKVKEIVIDPYDMKISEINSWQALLKFWRGQATNESMIWAGSFDKLYTMVNSMSPDQRSEFFKSKKGVILQSGYWDNKYFTKNITTIQYELIKTSATPLSQAEFAEKANAGFEIWSKYKKENDDVTAIGAKAETNIVFNYKYPLNSFKNATDFLDWDQPTTDETTAQIDDLVASFNFKDLSYGEKSAIENYTNSDYKGYNATLRQAFSGGKMTGVSSAVNHLKNIISAFNKAAPLDHDIMVYRGTNVPPADPMWDIHTNLIDAGFLSTSTKPQMAKEWGEQTSLMISIPKGSKIIPAYHISTHKSEFEILLPPCSILKPIEVLMRPDKSKRQVIHCVFLGDGMNSFVQNYVDKAHMHESVSMLDKVYEAMGIKPGGLKKKDSGKFNTSAFGSLDTILSLNEAIKNGSLKTNLVPLKIGKK